MRVLILGGTGLLGKALVREWHSDEVISAGSRDVDIRDLAQVEGLVWRCKPDWTILAAAYTDVDGCELHPEGAYQVNSLGARHVALAARQHGSRLLFLSTDYVFDGNKNTPYEVDDSPQPMSVYGRSKLKGEAAVREILPDCCIVRTSWLFGVGGKCFPETLLQLARKQKEISVVTDQRGCPTYNRDLARAILHLVGVEAKGTLHATNASECSWFEFAQAITQAAGLRGVTIRPITTEELNRRAPRPRYSVLSGTSLTAYGVTMRPWREALHEYLEERTSGVDEGARVDLPQSSLTENGREDR